MSIGRRAVAAVISLVIVAASWVLGLGAFLWTFAATDFRWIAFAVSVLVAWIACMAIQLPFIWRRASAAQHLPLAKRRERRARPRR